VGGSRPARFAAWPRCRIIIALRGRHPRRDLRDPLVGLARDRRHRHLYGNARARRCLVRKNLTDGATLDESLADWPTLTREVAVEALRQANILLDRAAQKSEKATKGRGDRPTASSSIKLAEPLTGTISRRRQTCHGIDD
jgi:hypothetical protein